MFIASVISKIQAKKLLLKTKGPLSPNRKIIKVEFIYLPVYLFTINLEDTKGKLYTDKISIDGIIGEFAFFKEINYEVHQPDIINKFDFIISEKKARDIAVREYERSLFKNNLKTRNDVKITDLKPDKKIYYPYWIGYFKRKRAFDFDVIDAVSGDKQGVKMRPVFINLLLQSSNN